MNLLKFPVVFCLSFISFCSCSIPYEWKEINDNPHNSDYVFSLSTDIQDYVIEKEGDFLLVKARTYYFPQPVTPSTKKERMDVSFVKKIPQGNNNLENLICQVVQQGQFVPHSDAFLMLPEGCGEGMGIWFTNGKSYQWTVSFPEVDERNLRQLYSELNECLYSLFPQLKKYPTEFPYSKNPPEHQEGEVWSWYD